MKRVWNPIEEYEPNDHEIVLLEMPDNTYRLCVYLECLGFQLDGSDLIISDAIYFFIIPERK